MKKLLKALFFLIYLCAGARNAQALSVRHVKNWKTLAFQPANAVEPIPVEPINEARRAAKEQQVSRGELSLNRANAAYLDYAKNKEMALQKIREWYSELQQQCSRLEPSLDPGLQSLIGNKPIVAHNPQEKIEKINRRNNLIKKTIEDNKKQLEQKVQEERKIQDNTDAMIAKNPTSYLKPYFNNIQEESRKREEAYKKKHAIFSSLMFSPDVIGFFSKYYDIQGKHEKENMSTWYQERINLGNSRRELSALEGRPWQSDDPD